jgi:hypothetical protein
VLTVTTTGQGSVTSAPAGIDCPGTCTAGFPDGSQVTLTATPADGWRLASWGGACTGAPGCAVTPVR